MTDIAATHNMDFCDGHGFLLVSLSLLYYNMWKSIPDKTEALVAKEQVIRCYISDTVATSHSEVKIRYMDRA